MGVEIPRILPQQTPASTGANDAARVRPAPLPQSLQAIQASREHARMDRRVLPERRRTRERRPRPLDLRAGRERRATGGVNVDV